MESHTASPRTVVVLCLEGCHGSGKTALTQQYKELGFTTLDEGFLTQEKSLLHPQSLFMETVWVTAWFSRLMKHIADAAPSRVDSPAAPLVLVADRSPYSAVFYSQTHGRLLVPLIDQYVHEMREKAGVHIVTVNLQTQRELLWERILARLAREPGRAALREDRREWMDAVCDFYECGMAWHTTVHNNEVPISRLAAHVLEQVTATAHADVCVALGAYAERAAAGVAGSAAGGAAAADTLFCKRKEAAASDPIAAFQTPVRPPLSRVQCAAAAAGADPAAAAVRSEDVSPQLLSVATITSP